ncbi:hypothetical protein CPB84DRAFT_1777040 [Gymnopilus junonius]|uniref:Uncharacterized protein n=1 Tax=Gymnopilus junonius TaxID=109634 RepID=A0A9P5TMS0_GYMJU|nr:hypothetical protein CPB84DRAFT_1777040 [Gymnopilus junonius]
MSTSATFSGSNTSAATSAAFSSSSSDVSTTSSSSPPTSPSPSAAGFSSSTFFPFSPPPSASTSTSSTLTTSSHITSPSLTSPNPGFAASPSFSSMSSIASPTQNAVHPISDAQAASDNGSTWTPGEIALVAVCSFVVVLAVVACILVVVIRRRMAKKKLQREFDFVVQPPDAAPNRNSIGSVEKYGYGWRSEGGSSGKVRMSPSKYLAGVAGGHQRSLSAGVQAEAETRGTAPLLSRKIRPMSSRHSHDAVYDDDEPPSPYDDGNDNDDEDVHRRGSEYHEPRTPLGPSSAAVPLLASASSPALVTSASRLNVPAPPTSWRPPSSIPPIPPVPTSPPPPSPAQQQLMQDLQSVENLYSVQLQPQSPSRRSSKATRRSSRRAFADINVNADGYNSDDSESMYSQASAPVSASASSLISSKSVRPIYGRQSRAGQELVPPPSGTAAGPGGLPSIPQSPSGGSVYGKGDESQRQSVVTIRPAPSTSMVLSQTEEEEESVLSNPDQAALVAKLLQSRQKNIARDGDLDAGQDPSTPTRSSTLVSHIERNGSIKPALALESVEEASETSSTVRQMRR